MGPTVPRYPRQKSTEQKVPWIRNVHFSDVLAKRFSVLFCLSDPRPIPKNTDFRSYRSYRTHEAKGSKRRYTRRRPGRPRGRRVCCARVFLVMSLSLSCVSLVRRSLCIPSPVALFPSLPSLSGASFPHQPCPLL